MYGLAEKSIYFDYPLPFKEWCKTSLHERDKYYNVKNIKWLNITQQFFNNNPTKFNKQDESILQHIPEQNSISILFKPKIGSDNTSDEENDNRISLYNLFYIKKNTIK